MRIMIVALLLAVFVATSSFAKDITFATTSNEIVEGLTETSPDPPQIITRGSSPSRGATTRGIAIRENTTVTGSTIAKKNHLGKKEPKKINLMILFDVNSSTIRVESYQLLAELGKALSSQQLKNKSIVINGHTDSDGDDEYNLELSRKRAHAVQHYLLSNHDIPLILEVRGWGERAPLVANNSERNRQINRRVEIVAQDKMDQ